MKTRAFRALAGVGLLALACPVLAEREETRASVADVKLVFESEREEANDGSILWSRVVGDLDETRAQRVRRPWTHLDAPNTYQEEIWSTSRDGATTVYGYRVLERPNPRRETPKLVLAPPDVGPALAAELESGDPTAPLPLSIVLRGMPEWNVPLNPVAFTLSAADLAAAEQERVAALESRRSLGARLIEPVATLIESLGGEVVARGELGGWLTARVAPAGVRVLMERRELARLSLLRGRVVDHAQWTVGGIRSDSFIDARQFLDAGYTGETGNPTRHAYGDITIGVVESGQIEDEGCFMYDLGSCSGTSRLQAMYRCDDFDRDGNYCEPVGGFRDNDKSASHGTAVTSVIAGDYRQGQGDAYALGDPNWTPESGHDAVWENQATGIAPEASIVYFGQVADNDNDDGTTTSPSFADAFVDAIALGVDITNSSWGWTGGGTSNCSLIAGAPHEIEAENAFDAGIFMVTSAGNPNTGVCDGDRGQECNKNADCAGGTGPCIATTSACNIGSPAGIPKTFAVNGLNGEETNCEAAYGNCLTDPEFSANGGLDADTWKGTCSRCVSGVSLTAPNRICQSTGAAGTRGTVGGCFAGTSASAPVVAGAAALVKDQYLSNGQAFINDPGRLHAVMLAMGDRHTHAWGDTSSSQMAFDASRLTGLGRLKMRLLENGANMDPWGNHVLVRSFASSIDDHTYAPWSQPMPAGTEMVKCVAYRVEDMSSKSTISRVDLQIDIEEALTGLCDPGLQAPVLFTRQDRGFDVKKMVTVTSDDLNLANWCARVTLDPVDVQGSSVTVITNCYYSGVRDEFSAPGS